MAIVQGSFSVQLEDYLGVVASSELPIQVDTTTTVAQLITAMQGYAGVFDAVTGAKLNLLTCSLVALPLGTKSEPIEGDEIEKCGLFNYSQQGSRYKYGVLVPAIIETAIVNGKINLLDQAVEAFDAWLKIAHSQVQAVSKYGLLLVAMVDALISFRKHRKAESRRSFEVPSV